MRPAHGETSEVCETSEVSGAALDESVMAAMMAAVMTATVTAVATLGAGEGRVEQCKAERSGRSDGQKGGFT